MNYWFLRLIEICQHESEGNNIYSEELNLIDPWRLMHQTKREYTLYSNIYQNFFRLDCFLMTDFIYHQIQECNIKVCYASNCNAVIFSCIFQKLIMVLGNWHPMFF